MKKQVALNEKPQITEFCSEEVANNKGWRYIPRERTLNWLGVFLIVLFSILSFGIYLIPCAIQGVWILPNSCYSKPKLNFAKAQGSAYLHKETANQGLTEANTTNIDQQQQIVPLQTVNPTVGPLQDYVQHQPLVTLNTNGTITINTDLALAALAALSTNVAIFSQHRQPEQETRILPLENYLALLAPVLSMNPQTLALAIEQPSSANPSVLFITRESMKLMSTFLNQLYSSTLLNQLYSRILHNNFITPTHLGSHLIEGQMVQLSSRSIAQYESPSELRQEAHELLWEEGSTPPAVQPLTFS
jgi:hypothetical protein